MRQTYFLLLLVTSSLFSNAQLSAGIFGGISNYQGDLVDKAYVGRFTKPAIGINVGYELSDKITLRAGLTFAKVAGDDKYNTKEYLQIRNLNFQSNITELSVRGEYNVFSLNDKRFTPFVFGGIALYHFNPYTTLGTDDQKVYLQPLGTEGQGITGYANKPYSLTQLAIPLGGGVKFGLTETVQIGLEVGVRKLFTDYLDDVSTNYADPADLLNARGPLALDISYRGDEVAGGDPNYPAKGAQRGGSDFKDWYYFTGLNISFKLGSGYGSGGSYKSGRKGYGCPTIF
jgi:hypothetical protein